MLERKKTIAGQSALLHGDGDKATTLCSCDWVIIRGEKSESVSRSVMFNAL